MNKLVSFTAILLLATVFTAAQTVNVRVLWASPSDEQQIVPFVEAMIGGCLLELFEKGYMGTNSVPQKADAKEFETAKPFAEDVEAFIDFVIYIHIEIPDLKAKPVSLRYRLVSVTSGKELYKGNFILPALIAVSRQDYLKYYHTLGTLIVKELVSKVSIH